MISMQELNPHNYPTTPEIDTNLNKLYEVMNKVRDAYGKPMIVNSGLRSMEDQMRINPSAPKSKHLIGAACDIADSSGELYDWCKANEQTLKDCGVAALEERRGGWQHFQILPVVSGHFWFIP